MIFSPFEKKKDELPSALKYSPFSDGKQLNINNTSMVFVGPLFDLVNVKTDRPVEPVKWDLSRPNPFADSAGTDAKVKRNFIGGIESAFHLNLFGAFILRKILSISQHNVNFESHLDSL